MPQAVSPVGLIQRAKGCVAETLCPSVAAADVVVGLVPNLSVEHALGLCQSMVFQPLREGFVDHDCADKSAFALNRVEHAVVAPEKLQVGCGTSAGGSFIQPSDAEELMGSQPCVEGNFCGDRIAFGLMFQDELNL